MQTTLREKRVVGLGEETATTVQEAQVRLINSPILYAFVQKTFVLADSSIDSPIVGHHDGNFQGSKNGDQREAQTPYRGPHTTSRAPTHCRNLHQQ